MDHLPYEVKNEHGMLMISAPNSASVNGNFFLPTMDEHSQNNLMTSVPTTNSSSAPMIVVQPQNTSQLISSSTSLLTNSSSVAVATYSQSNSPLQSPTVSAAMQSPTSLSNCAGQDMCSTSSSSAQVTPPGDSSVVMADSNSTKQVFVPCKVCGDKASGYHYGVTSCEGCKGFFRRSIQKQIEYRCLRDGKCLVMRLNRNRCQYCRFKKCLAVGMSRDSVRYGRVPKRSRSLDEQRVTTTGSESVAPPCNEGLQESRQLAMYDIILTMSQAHHANCLTTEDKVKQLKKKPASLLDVMDTGVADLLGDNLAEQHRSQAFQSLAALVTPVINLVVAFAKQVPGFGDLAQDDQLILIKSGFFEIWMTRMVRMFNHAEGSLTFGDGSVIQRSELDLAFTPELVAAMFAFAKSFTLLRLNDTEIGLFTGVVLSTPDRAGLSDKKAVEVTQDRLIEALKLQISRNHALEPNLFASLLMRVPELRTLGSKHVDLLDWYRQHWFMFQLPPLYAEIYDVPRPDAEGGTTEEPTAAESPYQPIKAVEF